ncbi:MAG: PAS domain S-box protein, partial [Actinomycetota bacterium]|nr:PAS domain S-box protein [Actinomycetota bacterium]
MLPLAQFSRPVRIAVYLLWTAGLAGLAVFALAAAFGDARASGFQVPYVCLPFVFGALCILRAALIHRERVAWALFGIGMLFFGSGYAYYFRFLQHLDSPPYPSVADAHWITYCVLTFVAVMFLVRARLLGLRQALWIDVVVGALALAAVGAALLVDPLIASTGGSAGAVTTGLSYPLLDLLMISVVLGVFALGKWRLSRTWALILCGLMIQATGDVIYLYQVARGTYEGGTLLDLTFPTTMSLVALAAWQKPVVTRSRQLQGMTALAIAAGFALIGLILIAFDHVRGINDVAFALAMLTLIAAFARAATTYADVSKRFLIQNESILNSAGEGIYGIDSDGTVTFANPAAMRMTGHEIGELDGRCLHEVIHHTRPDGTPCLVHECPMMGSLKDGVVHRRDDDVYWRKDGTSLPVEYTTTPIVEHGEVNGAVVVCKDVTERRELERTKDEFTSVVSHELRTPLTSIRGSLGLLESGVLGPLPEKGQRMIEIAVENTDRLVRLINDILDIERIGSGKIDMHRQPGDAADLIAAAAEGLQSLAAEAQVTLRA